MGTFKEGPCTDCGGSFPPYVMDFDHLPGTKKTLAVSYLANHGSGKAKLLAEIAKCELVCANCHRIRTHTRKKNRLA